MIEENASASPIEINVEKLNYYKEKLRLEQNLAMGLLAGVAACLVSAGLWAVITVVTEYQIGYMAIGVGFLVGYSIRYAGKGIDQIFGVMGAVLALIGCMLGNLFSVVAILSAQFSIEGQELGFFAMLFTMDFPLIIELMIETFGLMDLLFYGIAIYEGYKFSFRQITEDELRVHAS